MITTTQMYWLVILDSIVAAGILVLVIGILGSLVAFLGHVIEGWSRWPFVTTMCLFVLGLVTLAFVPSTKQMAAIMVVPKLANSEKIQTVGNHLYELAVEWMEELRPKAGQTEAGKDTGK